MKRTCRSVFFSLDNSGSGQQRRIAQRETRKEKPNERTIKQEKPKRLALSLVRLDGWMRNFLFVFVFFPWTMDRLHLQQCVEEG